MPDFTEQPLDYLEHHLDHERGVGWRHRRLSASGGAYSQMRFNHSRVLHEEVTNLVDPTFFANCRIRQFCACVTSL
jgi:hypothetical protein